MSNVSNDRGFVLVLVLVTVALLSAGAIGILLQARASASNADLHLKTVEARALLDAGSARIFHAFVSPDDPMPLRDAFKGRSMHWMFGGVPLEIFIEDESRKPDVNHAPTELILAFSQAAELDLRSRQEFAEALLRARKEGKTVPSLAALLDQCGRLSGQGRGLERYLTILTAEEGVAVRSMDGAMRALIPGIRAADLAILREHENAGSPPYEDQRLAHLHRFLSDSSGLSTIVIRTPELISPSVERRIAFGRIRREPYVYQIRSFDRSVGSSDICESSY